MQVVFSSKFLKTFLLALLLLAGIFVNVVFSADRFRRDPDVVGKIVDFDTREPIADVVVMAIWTTDSFRLTIEPKTEYYDYFEILSDKNGEFRIPGKGLVIFRNINPPKIEIFKTGYSSMYLKDLGIHFKRDGRYSDQVEWVDGKPIIGFRKKSLEERKKSIKERLPVPFYEMGGEDLLPEKFRLYTEEIKREFQTIGMTPYWERDYRYLHYKEGGVFPSQELAIEPKKN